ncbi:MAG: hypothetical protein AABW56_00880 [Nanoarchaeota archaeon]
MFDKRNASDARAEAESASRIFEECASQIRSLFLEKTNQDLTYYFFKVELSKIKELLNSGEAMLKSAVSKRPKF